MSLYEQNLQALFRQNSQLATQLFGLSENSKFEVFVDENDTLNVNIVSKEHFEAIYPGRPVDENIAKFETFETHFSRYPYLYCFGIGNGIFYKLLLQNTLHKRIIVIEPELELLFIALHFNDFVMEIDEGRLWLLWSPEQSFASYVEFFLHKEAIIFAKTYHLEILNDFYEQRYAEQIIFTNSLLVRAIEHAVYGIGNDSTDALIGLEHHLANLERMVETPTTLELFSKIKTSNTAVIVSTGPSLQKQLALLKQIAPYVTLFCIDASFPILEREGIKPDLVFSIERVIETAKFYHETSKDFHEDVIFCITSIAHPLLFDAIKAGTLQISMRPFGYTRYFDIEAYGYLGIGMSAANMAFEAIFHAKFENCILIGQDLAYGSDGETHSDGHLYGTKESRKRATMDVTAYGGEGSVKTTEIWNLFRNFFESDIYYAKQQGMQVINATEGGARIEGSVEMPFAEAISLCVDLTQLKKRIKLHLPHQMQIEESRIQVQRQRAHMLEYALKMQKNVQLLFTKVAQTIDELDAVDALHNYGSVDFNAIANLMYEIDAVKTYFDEQEFVDIFIDATQALIVHQELELAKLQVRPIANDDDKRAKMLEWIYLHRPWLFTLSGLMEAVVTAIQRSQSQTSVIGKITLNGNFIDGFVFDVKDATKEFDVAVLIDSKCVAEIKPTMKQKHLFYEEEGAYRFVWELPPVYFDDSEHEIIIKERVSGRYLDGAPLRLELQRNTAVSGIAYSGNGVHYVGWCKKSGSSDIMAIDVWIDGVKVDTIDANADHGYIDNIYEGKEQHGFSYLMPEQYFDNKLHQVRFLVSGTYTVLENRFDDFEIKKAMILGSHARLRGNLIDGFILNRLDATKILDVDIMVDGVSVSTVTPTLPFTHPISRQEGSYRFVWEIPASCFDNTEHVITIREKGSGAFLEGMPLTIERRSPASVSGEVYSENGIYYSGWCKKSGSNEKMKLEVRIDGKYVDTLIADSENEYIDKIFLGKEKYGFRYLIPESYCDNRKHHIEFFASGTDTVLKNQFDDFELIRRDARLVQKMRFLSSLNNRDVGHVDIKAIEGTIGFMAVPEQLKDKEFTDYLKALLTKFPEACINAFYIVEEDIEILDEIFQDHTARIFRHQCLDIMDVLQHCTIWVFSIQARSDETVNGTTLFIQSKAAHIFTIGYQGVLSGKFADRNHDISNTQVTAHNVFGHTQEELERCQYNLVRLNIEKAFLYAGIEVPETDLERSWNTVFYFDIVEYALKTKAFRQYYFKIRKIDHDLRYKNIST